MEEPKWVTGAVFSNLITHTLVKKKYVFDATREEERVWVTLDSYYEQEACVLSQQIGGK